MRDDIETLKLLQKTDYWKGNPIRSLMAKILLQLDERLQAIESKE